MVSYEIHKTADGAPAADASARGRSLADLCKAASDPLRVDILRVLSHDSFGVQELASILSMPQPGMSHHLKILFNSGLVETRRQGTSIFYRRALLKGSDALSRFQGGLYSAIDALPLSKTFERNLGAVHQERAQRSRLFFERNAEKFEEKQGLLCDLGQYASNLNELLDLMALPAKTSRVLEVGPGMGGLLEELTKRFGATVALDSSGEMLALARGKAKESAHRVEFVQGSLESYQLDGRAFDAAVLNMVMHHMASPAQAFQKLGDLVRREGYVLIADLCSHNQEWARESCGDLWLGFDPKDLTDWAARAGFHEEQSLYSGLNNGFQIQLKLFSKR